MREMQQNKVQELEIRLTKLKNRSFPSSPMNINWKGKGSTGVYIIGDLLCGIFTGGILGYNLDKLFESRAWFSVALILLGMAGGFYNFYRYEYKLQYKEIKQ